MRVWYWFRLIVPRDGGFFCLNVGSRLVLVSYFIRVLCLFAFGVGPSRRVRWFSFSALLDGCGPSRFALVLIVLCAQ